MHANLAQINWTTVLVLYVMDFRYVCKPLVWAYAKNICIMVAIVHVLHSCENIYSALLVEPMELQFIIQGDRWTLQRKKHGGCLFFGTSPKENAAEIWSCFLLKLLALGLGSSSQFSRTCRCLWRNVLFVYVLLESWTCFVAKKDTLVFERWGHALLSSKWILNWIDLVHLHRSWSNLIKLPIWVSYAGFELRCSTVVLEICHDCGNLSNFFQKKIVVFEMSKARSPLWLGQGVRRPSVRAQAVPTVSNEHVSCVGCPLSELRLQDEVFSGRANREKSLERLLCHVKIKRNKQFLLIEGKTRSAVNEIQKWTDTRASIFVTCVAEFSAK